MKALEDLPRGLANAIALEDDAEALLEEPGVATTGDKIYRVANSQLEAALVEAGKDGAPQVIGEFMYPYIEGWATQAGSDGAGPKLTGMLLEMPSAELLHLTESVDALNDKLREALKVLVDASKAAPAPAPPTSTGTSTSTARLKQSGGSGKQRKQRQQQRQQPQPQPQTQTRSVQRNPRNPWGSVTLSAEAQAFKHVSGPEWPTLPTESLMRSHYDTKRQETEDEEYYSDYSSDGREGRMVIGGDDLQGDLLGTPSMSSKIDSLIAELDNLG